MERGAAGGGLGISVSAPAFCFSRAPSSRIFSHSTCQCMHLHDSVDLGCRPPSRPFGSFVPQISRRRARHRGALHALAGFHPEPPLCCCACAAFASTLTPCAAGHPLPRAEVLPGRRWVCGHGIPGLLGVEVKTKIVRAICDRSASACVVFNCALRADCCC